MTDDVRDDVYPAPTFGAVVTDPVTEELGAVSEPLDGADWPTRTVSGGLKMRIPTAVLLALLVAGGAFWGGVALEKGHTTSTSGFAGLASRFARGTAAGGTGTTTKTGSTGGGFAGFGGASTAAATGTVTVIEGNTVYVTSASGSIVKVELTPTTKVTRNASVAVSALKPGDTVVVEGSTAKSGSVSATSIAATAAGVTTTRF